MGSNNLFRTMQAMTSFREVANPDAYVPVPADWFVIVTDVRNSTVAIESGRYKDVNVLGAGCIVAVLNACDAHNVPFVFGGDGATLLVTADELNRATDALLGLAATARRVLELDLRVGIVPVQEILDAGHSLSFGKFALGGSIELAMFSGSGFGYAEELVKGAQTEAQYTRQPTGEVEHPDVTGLECRWRPLASRNGQFVSVLVMARADDASQRAKIYLDVLDAFEEICPVEQVHPVHRDQLSLQVALRAFETEARLQSGRVGGMRHLMQCARASLESRVGTALMRRRKKFAGFDGENYPAALIAQSDFRKFDDTLRMVVDLSASQQARLEELLATMYADGAVFYGLHHAASALMTCFIRDWGDDHLHFIDGGDGGYALAAKQLKAQIAAER